MAQAEDLVESWGEPAKPSAESVVESWGAQPPSKLKTFMQGQEPHTTAGSAASSFARGAAPYAAGAGLGATLGSVVPVVGTALGAGLGAGAVGLDQLAGAVYNPIADKLGLKYRLSNPQKLTDEALDRLGLKRPQTPTDQLFEAGGAGLGSALSGVGTGNVLKALSSPLAGRIGAVLAARPAAQAAMGVTGAAASEEARQQGAGFWGQLGVGVAGGGLTGLAMPGTWARGEKAAVNALAEAGRTPAQKAEAAGFYLTPAQSGSKNPLSHGLAMMGGKTKLQQAISVKNQEVATALTRKDLGLPQDTPLDRAAFSQVRNQASGAYKAMIEAQPTLRTDGAFMAAADRLGSRSSDLAKEFPKLMNNPKVKELVDELKTNPDGSARDAISSRSAVELIKNLRADGAKNLKAFDDPDRYGLGRAQRQAADEMENLIERNLEQSGRTDLLGNYREARKTIAKSYDVESATNDATGNVSARHLGRLARRGKPLSDGLRTIADAANAFPKAFQNPEVFGGVEPVSKLDMALGAGASIATMRPEPAALMLGGPLARELLLSPLYRGGGNALKGLAQSPPLPRNLPRIPLPPLGTINALGQQPQQ
jgi:hypothetical protein